LIFFKTGPGMLSASLNSFVSTKVSTGINYTSLT